MDAFQVTVALVCFFHHSPLAGANDEKSTVYLILYPGLRLLRSLSLGYHLSPFQGLEWPRIFSIEQVRLCATRLRRLVPFRRGSVRMRRNRTHFGFQT
jgi:hypothetical protein